MEGVEGKAPGLVAGWKMCDFKRENKRIFLAKVAKGRGEFRFKV
jgi:hypothetical protein